MKLINLHLVNDLSKKRSELIRKLDLVERAHGFSVSAAVAVGDGARTAFSNVQEYKLDLPDDIVREMATKFIKESLTRNEEDLKHFGVSCNEN